jgi:hypothetical protein
MAISGSPAVRSTLRRDKPYHSLQAVRNSGVRILQARQRVLHKHQTPHEATLHCDQKLGSGTQEIQSGKCSRRSREADSKERKIRGVKEWCRYKSHAQQRRELSCLSPWGGRPA